MSFVLEIFVRVAAELSNYRAPWSEALYMWSQYFTGNACRMHVPEHTHAPVTSHTVAVESFFEFAIRPHRRHASRAKDVLGDRGD